MSETEHGGTEPQHGGSRPRVDLSDRRLSRFEIVQEGARRDDIEIVHYEPPFPVPGTKAERRLTRSIGAMFLLTGLASTAFMVIYIWWPFEYDRGSWGLYTPLLGVTLGVALLGIGFGLLSWGKKLLPREISIQDRHTGPSSDDDRTIAAQTMLYMADEIGVRRRPLLGLTALLGLAPVGLVAAAPLVGGLIKQPHEKNQMFTTGWDPEGNDGDLVSVTREDGTRVRPEDISPGGQMTVFPGIPHGHSNLHADSPVLLIHLREDDAEVARSANERAGKQDYMYGNYIAYSKICTHAGCPASLYEQQTNRLLCPCHQSQFLITDNAKPIFGPASRRLPQLPIEVDADGFFVAKSDFTETVGPDFWERP
ncbi:ubiquinol-cytochrome c reductase iron-sulfur subunit [Plantactinospora sp. GCM10030261]|uniref:cytochrome bc1 complex Rieske iron-sulfur subunit n=1 Tax=Plantactinospora sp. GCM10030261 TaxID=3273420 RepID=UPI00360E76E9